MTAAFPMNLIWQPQCRIEPQWFWFPRSEACFFLRYHDKDSSARNGQARVILLRAQAQG